MEIVSVIALSTGLLVLGFVVGWLISSKIVHKRFYRTDATIEQILEDARREAETEKRTALLEAKDQIYHERAQAEKALEDRNNEVERKEEELDRMSNELNRRADLLNHKAGQMEEQEQKLVQQQDELSVKELELEAILEAQNARLERIAALTRQQAKRELMENLEAEAQREVAWRLKEIREDAQARANDEAREIIASAIQRLAVDYTVESTVTVVELPADEMKGRIIGREGRNIRSFEMCTGVDVIVDDTPKAVVLSGFDPIRRAIAKTALEHLLTDGRIHPGRIEEVVEKSRENMHELIRQAGEEAIFDMGVPGLHDRLIECLGRLKFQTSYGQNMLNHSKEVAFLAGMMAMHLGLDAQLAKRAGLLHDIGQGINHEFEDTPGQNGADMAKKYGEDEEVINAIEAHHGEADPISPIAVLVDAADAISRVRPGARREVLENYVRRLEHLEQTAREIEGVDAVYAIQAGQEIRVVANYGLISDEDTERLSAQIAERLEKTMTYPGHIKVTVIREVRAVNFAR